MVTMRSSREGSLVVKNLRERVGAFFFFFWVQKIYDSCNCQVISLSCVK